MAHTLRLPATTVLGRNALQESAKAICKLGTKALIVAGKSMQRQGFLNLLLDLLRQQQIPAVVYSEISNEPTGVDVQNGAELYRSSGCDFIIGFGGGSQLDAAKAIGILASCPGKLSDYVGTSIFSALPPIAAIPTTAGTGSEATQFTIITDTKTQVKMLLKGEALMPTLAVVDPLFSSRMPRSVTVSTGLDALTHAVEAYTSRKAFAESDLFALSAVKRIFRYLPMVLENGNDLDAREQMAIAAYEAGVSFSNSSVTIVHGMSRPIGALFHVPHGLSNAMLLKTCLEYIADGAYPRFASLAREIGVSEYTESDQQASDKFIEAVEQLCLLCRVPTLWEYGIEEKSYFDVIEKMAGDAIASGSPANTRKEIQKADVIEVYRQLWR